MLRKIVHGDRRDGADDRLGAGPAGGKNLLPRTPLEWRKLLINGKKDLLVLEIFHLI